MAIFDIVILAVLALAAVMGFFKGFVKPLFRLLEVIVTFGLGLLAALAMIWLNLASIEEPTIVDIGILAGAFLVMFIIAMVICDYLFNKFKYGKHKFKNVVADKIWGVVISILLAATVIYLLMSCMTVLEATEYGFYNLPFLVESKVGMFMYEYNPFSFISAILKEQGVAKIIVQVIHGIIPNIPPM